MRVMTVIGQLQQDARYAVRVAARQPGTSLIIVLSLALGIGANTLVFSLVNGILLRAFPYPEPERLVMFWFTPPDRPEVRAGLANAGACMDLRLESTVEDLIRTIHAHPTFAEAVGEAAHATHGAAIHS